MLSITLTPVIGSTYQTTTKTCQSMHMGVHGDNGEICYFFVGVPGWKGHPETHIIRADEFNVTAVEKTIDRDLRAAQQLIEEFDRAKLNKIKFDY